MRRALLSLVAAVAFALPQPAHVAERAAEEQIKAAFLFHFTSFVEWPADAHRGDDDAIVVGVVGAAGIADVLSNLVAGRSAKGRPIEVVRMRPDESRGPVHLLFVGRGAGASLTRLAQEYAGLPVLVVTEVPGGIAGGAMIELFVHDDRVRFDVAVDEISRRGMHASSRMLEVARHVVTER